MTSRLWLSFSKKLHLAARGMIKSHDNKHAAAYHKHRGEVSYLIFDLPPWKLTNRELHQHVKEGPQIIMSTHLLEKREMKTEEQSSLLLRSPVVLSR